jgi:hypothetical protein
MLPATLTKSDIQLLRVEIVSHFSIPSDFKVIGLSHKDAQGKKQMCTFKSLAKIRYSPEDEFSLLLRKINTRTTLEENFDRQKYVPQQASIQNLRPKFDPLSSEYGKHGGSSSHYS